jgi:hypothetical protein
VAFLKEEGKGDPVSAGFKAGSTVLALARDPADLGDLAARAGWRRIEPAGTVAAWTDDYSNVLGAMIRRKFGF